MSCSIPSANELHHQQSNPTNIFALMWLRHAIKQPFWEWFIDFIAPIHGYTRGMVYGIGLFTLQGGAHPVMFVGL